MVSSVGASRLIIPFGKRVLQAGALIMGIGFFLQMSLWKPGIPGWLIVLLMCVWGIGNGLVLPSLLNIALRSVPAEYAGAAAGVYSTFQQTASALGISIIGGVFFYFARDGWQKAYHAGILLILFCVLMVSIMLFLLPDGRPAIQPTLAVE
jgi:MFS family permease